LWEVCCKIFAGSRDKVCGSFNKVK
jgi:hypothetical protein